jgi:hypothetical protein
MNPESTPSAAGQSVVTSSVPAANPATVPSAAKPLTQPQPQQQQQQKQKPGKPQRKGGFGFNPAPKA